MDPSIFKAYDIRGIYPDQLNEEAAWKIGHAAAQFLRSLLRGYQRGQAKAQAVCVGRDMRTHSRSLAHALIEGMNASGANVIDLGMIDTPQMYFAINHLGTCGGVNITASHNPGQYNGMKISGLEAKPIGQDTGLKDVKHIAMALRHTKSPSGTSGSIETLDLSEEYRKFILNFLNPDVKGLKVVVDASNGMAGKMMPIIFGSMPIEIIPLNFTYDGSFKHDPNPLIEVNLAELKAKVVKNRAHFGVCFDGDADRLVVVDEKGTTVPADLLLAMMVPYFLKKEPHATIIYDLRSSWVVREDIQKYGGTPRRDRVGHVFMKKTLRDTHGIVGGELSGHYYYRDNFYADSALITFTHVLNILYQAQKPLSELIAPMKKYFDSGEINFKVDDKEAMMKELVKKYKDGQYDDLDGVTIQYKDWWFNCRPSNTEPLLRLNVEAKSRELLDTRLAELESLLGMPVEH
jgi:phosphomannomutase